MDVGFAIGGTNAFVTRLLANGTTVAFTITDGCGTWPTFVVGGAGSF
jgi:hypothetical protein